ncbi:transcriptional regulator GcvA [Inquilinus limosus]|uniref:transcriptional regulator GcvA n=1 Tax=Inquilinus limosus TaxID=171674 RepID=UPI000428EC69|nr:transcriptional regulator GcvA [Inquilinus limosus]
MARRLPPLNALRAFEAAARHLSFVDAADELAVTPAAVSHQVKALEAHLGLPLFQRLARGLVLTEQGQALAPQLTRGFDRLAEAVARVRADGGQTVLSVTVLPSFAVRWLLPRLGEFRRLNPGIEIEVQAQHQAVDFRRERVDIALRYGRGGWPGLYVERFLDDEVFPVCSPKLLRDGPNPLRRPEDLRHHTLIHDVLTGDDEPWVTWQQWLLHFGLDDVDPRRGPRYSDSHMMLEAAASGEGVALGRSSIMADDLTSGRLVRPFPDSQVADYAYHFLCRTDAIDRPAVRAFRDWLVAVAADDPTAPATAAPASALDG